MIQKSEKCLYCGSKMESKTAKKKFCSTKCRVYWNRENSQPTSKGEDKKEERKSLPDNPKEKELSDFWKQRMAKKLGIK